MDDLSADLLVEGTLPRAWAARWREAPDGRALADDGWSWMPNRELDELTARAASRLRELGLEPGDRIIVSGATRFELVVAHVGALRAGLTVVPVNPTLTRSELDQLWAVAKPRAVVAGDHHQLFAGTELPGDWGLDRVGPFSGDVADRSERRADGLALALTVDELFDLLTDGLDSWWSRPPDASVELDAADPDDVALLAFTSGTTGRPKGVPLTHANLLAGAEALRRAWAWSPADCLLLSLPLFHMHGLGVGIHGTLLAGASAVLFERFEPDAIVRAAGRRDATMFFGVPTMYSRLVDTPGVERLGRLRLCVSGSAPLSAELHRRIHEVTGQVVLERYGMTETVMLTSNPLDGARRPGTVGVPLPAVDVRLDAETNGIEVRGPNVFGGYLDQPEANASAFTPDGWFRTGDIGRLDDGYLRIVGRAKDLIITGGYNVYPAEIEEVLRGHPGVVDAAVVGEPSEEWGEVIVAHLEVVAGAEPDLDAVARRCVERLASYKRPRHFHLTTALPRNALGKVQRDRLAPPEP